MRILKLHQGLYRYLRIELKRKRSSRELVFFLKKILESYIKEILKIVNYSLNYFNPIYVKQRIEYKKYLQYKKDLSNAWRILQFVLKQGKTKQERKQIKSDFIKFGRISKEVEQIILKDIYGGK